MMAPRHWLLATTFLLPGAWAHGADLPASASARASDGALCLSGIAAAERAARLPVGLMGAIGLVESGRPDPLTGRATPWPWTINVAGAGYLFATKAEAIVAVEAARARGIQSIDVGCMQVNLMHHPNAFASLDLAFEPATNAAYAADLLTRLFQASGDWFRATGAYHSSTPGIGEGYAMRVSAIWPSLGGGGLPVHATLGTAARAVAAARGPADLALVDPHNVYTPEFRARLQRDAADRSARLAAMTPVPERGARIAGRLHRPGVYTRLASTAAGAVRPW